MNRIKYLFLLVGVCIASFAAVPTGNYSQSSVLNNGGNTTATNTMAVFYSTTNGVVITRDDVYSTNRFYFRSLADSLAYFTSGTATYVIPKATNTSTGVIYGSFEQATPVSGTPLDATNSGTALSVLYASLGQTNTVTLVFQRSVNGGGSYDPTDTFSWTLTMGTALVPYARTTNLPPAFLNGASHVRLFSLTMGTNNTLSGNYPFFIANLSARSYAKNQ